MIPPKYWSPTKKLMVLGAMAGGKLVEATATGNPLTFITDVSKPLKSLLIPFTPQQEGTGDPSPENIRPILPWNGLTVFGGGKNLLNVANGGTGSGDWKMTFSEGKIENPTMGSGASDYVIFTQEIKAGTYTISFNCTSNISPRFLCTAPFQGGNYNSYYKAYYKDGKPITFTITESARVGVVFSAPNHVGEAGSIFDIQLEEGSTVTTYEPYKPITETDIPFASPVYGGTPDIISGRMLVEWAGFSATWGDGQSATDMGSGITRKIFPMVDYLTTGSANNMCNVAPYQASENAYTHFYYSGSGAINRNCRLFLPSDTPDSTEVTVITKLSQPYEVTLTPAQITALVGNNTIWADADGQMTAVYLKKG